MNELIKVENGTAILNPKTAKQIADFERKAKEIEEKENALRVSILQEMEDKQIKSVETDDLTITYKAPYDRESLDTKSLKKDFPDLCDDYIKMTTVKASVSIKLKEAKDGE